jgi:hypothetical protein
MADGEDKGEKKEKRKKRKKRRKSFKHSVKSHGLIEAVSRRIEDVAGDIKQTRKRKSAERASKKSSSLSGKKIKDTAKKSAYRDTREGRLKKKSKEMTQPKFVKRRWSKEDKENMKDTGVTSKHALVLKKRKPTAGAKRAKRVLNRMDEREQRKIGRKQKKTVRQNRMDTGKSPSAKPKKAYEKKMKRQGVDINKKVRGLNQRVN